MEKGLQIFGRPKGNGGPAPAFENLILFDEGILSLGLKKGLFLQQNDLDSEWVMQYEQGEKIADLQGMDVFEFLAELALEKKQD